MNILFINSINVTKLLSEAISNGWTFDYTEIDDLSIQLEENLPRYTHRWVVDLNLKQVLLTYNETSDFICYENNKDYIDSIFV
jgi:hypothetical protein